MVGIRFAVLCAISFVGLAAPALGQAPAGGVVYFAANVVKTADTGTIQYGTSNTLPPAGKAYAATSPGPVTYTTEFDYNVPAATSLSGMVHVQAFVACTEGAAYRPGNSNPANPVASSRAILLKGVAVVGQVDRYDAFTPCTGPSDVRELAFDVDSKGTALAAGDTLAIQVLVWWTNTPTSVHPNAFFVVGGATTPSRITAVGLGAPGASTGPAISYAILAGTTAHLAQSFATPSNATYRFNWTTELTQAVLQANVGVTSGGVGITIRDSQNTTRANLTLAASGNRTQEIPTAAAGRWHIEVAYRAFVGNLTLDLGAITNTTNVVSATNTTTSSGSTTAMSSTSTPTSKGSPLPWTILLAALGIAVVAVRRRA